MTMRWWTEGGREERVLEAIFRLAVAACFVGHGAFGILGKEAWLPYFAVAGIPESWAWVLMPMVGTVDILVGVLALVAPRPAILGYMVFWAAWTALLRPLAGESVFETLERAGNYGVPLAFLVAVGFSMRGSGPRDWLRQVSIGRMTPSVRSRVAWVLRVSACLLLVGHGGLAVSGKPLLASHMAAAGVDPGLLAAVGWGEILLGMAILVRPTPALLAFTVLWKVGTEALYPVTGALFWEFVERAGSYAAPLALLVMHEAVATRLEPASRLAGRTAATALVAVALVLGPTGVAAGTLSDPPANDVLERLQAGGLVLACRHAATDRSRGDARRVDYDDSGTQRVLSDEGRTQSRRLGEVLRNLGVHVGEVLTSPYARTRDTAELAFGRSTREDALVYGNREAQRRERRRLLRERPAVGNRVLMSHQGVLYSMLPEVERGSIREGDCVVVAPRGPDGFDTLGTFGPEDFAELGAMDRAPALHTSRTISTSFAGAGPRIMK